MIKSLSVFFPLFNEEGNVELLVQKATAVLQNLKLEYEIILVNDGSTDRTAEVIDKIVKENPRVRAINHPKNLGYGEALKSGFYNAKYDTIVYTDGDGQFDFSEIGKFLEKIDEYDVIIGYRIKRQDPFFRILFKQGWKLSLLAFFRLTLKDVDCGFKMVRKEVLEKISHLESSRGAMINAELAIKAKKAGFKIGQVGVNHYPRLTGKPTGANLKVIIKSYLDLIKLWWELKEQKAYFIAILGVLVLAAFFRLYKIDQYMIFLGDQGRDAVVIKQMLDIHHFPLIGPPTSVGNIYLGPLYYYMMLPSMAFFGLSPIAASVMVAFFGVAIVALIYYLGKNWFNRKSGLIAAFLYAISPINIAYSNFSWNPNPMPFFALLAIFGVYKINKTGNFLWFILTGAAVAACLQMHYLSLILIPITVILCLREILYRRNQKRPYKNLIKGAILGTVIFLILMSPLLWFDLRHDFLNYKALVALFSVSQTVEANIFANLAKIPQLFSYNFVGRYIAGQNLLLEVVVSLLIIFVLARGFIKRAKDKILDWPTMALGIWLLVGLIGVSLYKGEVYDHYLGFLNPAPFLLLGSLAAIQVKREWKIYLNLGLLILVGVLAFVNLQKNPLLFPPNNQLKRTQVVAKFIINKSNNQDFNFALLSKNNYDLAYQFYLDLYGHKPKVVPFNKTTQLFVVCEDPDCDPTHSPKYELAAFGMSKIDWMEEYSGVKIYRLIPNPSGKP